MPRDSARLSTSGCARGRLFIVRRSPDHETRGVELQEGRRLRLDGDKEALASIKKNERSMIEITGLIRQSDIDPPGINIAGGRVRIMPGAPPGGAMGRDPGPQQAVFDVESWRLLNYSCPNR